MRLGAAGRLAAAFLNSKLTPLIIVASLLGGGFAVFKTPREEEPQIVVPMVDVFAELPGASAKEVEARLLYPLERLAMQVSGVEYVYGTASPGKAMIVVRFLVGQDQERSLVRLKEKLDANPLSLPPGTIGPTLQARSIDDVPILALTLSGRGYDDVALRKLAASVSDRLKSLRDVSDVVVIGGRRTELRVEMDIAKLSSYRISPLALQQRIAAANSQQIAGPLNRGNQEVLAKTSGFVHSAAELGQLPIDQKDGSVVRLADVADVSLTPAEPTSYVYYGDKHGSLNPAVTISLSKRKGANAINVAHAALQMIETLRGSLIPNSVKVAVTRNYGETAAEKSNELLEHMLIAVFGVTILVALALGRRESAVVLIAIPVTLALTLLIFKLYGYTLNRITLFALIFSIGILVDDAIVVVENMVRHFRFPVHLRRPLHEAAVYAVDEVGNPTILATFTVIAAILPMAFVGGLMGPYMRPIPVGASAAMVFSLLVAFIITPWAALRLLRKEARHHQQEQGEADTAATRLYRRVMDRLIHSPYHRLAFFALMALLLMGAVAFLPLKWVTVKMLPFDNKNEFQIIVDMPEGSPLEKTFAATAAIVNQVRSIPEVTDYTIYAGTSGPYNFNGLVRHYFLRSGSNVADIQVNLVGKGDRRRQSHEVARSVRQDIQRIARRFGANVKIAEVPPGPPVLQTLVAEVYGQDYTQQVQLARRIKDIFQKADGVVDVDWYVEDPQPTVRFEIDQARTKLAGIQTQQAAETLLHAISSTSAGNAHIEDAKEEIPIVLRFPKSARAWEDQVAQVKLENAAGQLIPLATIVQAKTETSEWSIYHKNLRPVVYVTADVAGREESPVYAILKLNRELSRLPTPPGAAMQIYSTKQPFSPNEYAVKWDGEWHITYEVFRDLGIAFAAVMALIYLLVVGWFQSFRTPLVIMAPIPLTLVGILPAHAMLGAYFTATSMIGFIAGAGIIVRNSIILVDFVELRRKQGMPLDQAVIDAGAVRFRPMLLTAAAVMVGSSVILFDPIFQGLAVSLLAGEVASTLLSRLAVPVLYYLSEKRAEKHAVMRPSPAIPTPQ